MRANQATAAIAVALVFATLVAVPARADVGGARVLITAPIDTNHRLRLAGNTRPEATAANDRGRVPDGMILRHMQLLLTRPAERQAALQRFINDQYDRRSPNFHRWLGAEQIGQTYGLAPADIAAISAWLTQQGFTVNTVYPNAVLIDFSGTAGQVRKAFHTDIHDLQVGAVRHIANISDPEIPAALAPAVHGIVSLHDFRPHTNFRTRPAYTNGSATLVVPADLATIYNLTPLFTDGISGQGQTIVLIEDTNVYSTADWTAFRSALGLSSYTSASLSEVQPPLPSSGGANCVSPGVVSGNEREAALDVEWASAAAPSAKIELASCADTTTTFGGFIALENLVNSTSPPAIVSISYSECEAVNGAIANAAYNSLYEQAVAEGTSVFVSAGDSGAASCDDGASVATHGVGVSAFASTPYNVAVGGTDFGDTYAGTTGTYWSGTNSATYGSALSYIPEIPWNDSCASSLLASYEGYSTTYGSGGFCNSRTGTTNFLTTTAASGGPSGCATGTPATSEVVSGNCAGWPKPTWQSGVLGVPADGVRDLPDVSLFAANGRWGHYYVYCDSNTHDSGASCSGAPSTWSGAGGTSFGAPIMAGIQALINQKAGAAQGNPNPVFYAIAAAEYGASGNSACNSSNGNAVSASCVFYDITQGDMDVPCTGIIACYAPSGTNGVLSTSTTAYAKAYGASLGWDFATGIGTINAENLVNGWNTSDLTLAGSQNATATGLVTYLWTVGNSGPRAAAGVVLSTTLAAGLSLVPGSSGGNCTQAGQIVSCSIGTLAVGATAPLTIAVQASASQTVSLTFALSASNGELFPATDSVATSVTIPTDSGTTTAVPLPWWVNVILGALLLGVAIRQRSRLARLE